MSRLRGLLRPAGLSRDFQLFWAGNTSNLLETGSASRAHPILAQPLDWAATPGLRRMW